MVVLEREFAGYGASGRNGGWVAGAVSGVHDDATVAAITATVDEVGRAAAAEGIECAFHKGGALAVATGPTQLERLRDHPLAHGEWLEPDALRERVRIAGALGAVFDPNVARVQPAALVRGLADAVERLGVPIYEGTAVTAIEPRVARTAQGEVRAPWIVRATEGYTPACPVWRARSSRCARRWSSPNRCRPNSGTRSAGRTPRRSPTRRCRTRTSSGRPTAASRSAGAGVRTTGDPGPTGTARSRTGRCGG